MSEKELVQKAKSGDFEAFSKLVEKYKTKIYSLALKMSKNRQDAEDVLQETFLKAVDNIDQFRGESAFGTWLYAIATNVLRAQYAENSKADLNPIEDYLPRGHGTDDDSDRFFDWGDPHKILEAKQIQSIIDSSLKEMPSKYSMPFMFRYYEDLSVKEIAETMNLSVAATKSRILRARLALREKLSFIMKEKMNERV